MIWSVVSGNDIFYNAQDCAAQAPVKGCSSNPYDYIRCGYSLDHASMFGGKDIVDFNSDFSGNRAGTNLFFSLV